MRKPRALALPAWIPAVIDDERSLLHYLMSKHDGHPYAEDLIDGICLIASWGLIAIALLSVVGVLLDAALR